MVFLKIDTDFQRLFSPHNVERAANATLDLSGRPDADLTLVLTDDDHLRALNREFLSKDAPTDVLSFPADEPDPETGRRYLGDVIVSVERAESQAEGGGHPLEAELQLLVVHGILHLLGYDHAAVDEKTNMWAIQAEVLERIGVSPAIVHD